MEGGGGNAKAKRSHCINLRNNSVLNQSSSSGGGEKWAVSEYILKDNQQGLLHYSRISNGGLMSLPLNYSLEDWHRLKNFSPYHPPGLLFCVAAMKGSDLFMPPSLFLCYLKLTITR